MARWKYGKRFGGSNSFLTRIGRWPLAVVAFGYMYLSAVYLTLPDVRPLATDAPATTAFIELRAREAAGEARPVGAEQAGSGYAVAWKNTGADQFSVWSTDSSGNFVSNTAPVSGAECRCGAITARAPNTSSRSPFGMSKTANSSRSKVSGIPSTSATKSRMAT